MKNANEIFSDPIAVAWAKVVEGEFSYPVDSVVLSAAGKPLSQISIEEMFKTLRSGKAGRSYHDVLQEAIEGSN